MACELSIQYAALIAGLYSANAITLPLLQGLMGKQLLAWGAGQRHSHQPNWGFSPGGHHYQTSLSVPAMDQDREGNLSAVTSGSRREGSHCPNRKNDAHPRASILANGRDRLLFAIFGCSLFALADLSLDTISCTIQPQECSHFLTALNLDHSAWGK